MSSLTVEAKAQNIIITDDTLAVDLSDGRSISVPLAWYPRLLHGTPEERKNWRFIGNNEGIHWPDLDEDISVVNLLLGQPSGESQASFKRWMDERGRQVQVVGKAFVHSPASNNGVNATRFSALFIFVEARGRVTPGVRLLERGTRSKKE